MPSNTPPTYAAMGSQYLRITKASPATATPMPATIQVIGLAKSATVVAPIAGNIDQKASAADLIGAISPRAPV